MHAPEVLFLSEPSTCSTGGPPVLGGTRVRALQRPDDTIVLTTHDMDESRVAPSPTRWGSWTWRLLALAAPKALIQQLPGERDPRRLRQPRPAGRPVGIVFRCRCPCLAASSASSTVPAPGWPSRGPSRVARDRLAHPAAHPATGPAALPALRSPGGFVAGQSRRPRLCQSLDAPFDCVNLASPPWKRFIHLTGKGLLDKVMSETDERDMRSDGAADAPSPPPNHSLGAFFASWVRDISSPLSLAPIFLPMWCSAPLFLLVRLRQYPDAARLRQSSRLLPRCCFRPGSPGPAGATRLQSTHPPRQSILLQPTHRGSRLAPLPIGWWPSRRRSWRRSGALVSAVGMFPGGHLTSAGSPGGPPTPPGSWHSSPRGGGRPSSSGAGYAGHIRGRPTASTSLPLILTTPLLFTGATRSRPSLSAPAWFSRL